RAQAPLVDRAVRIALDLEELGLAAGRLAGVGEERAADGAVRADRVRDGRTLDAQPLLDVRGRGELEAEWGGQRPHATGRAQPEEITPGDLHVGLPSPGPRR